MTNKTKNFKPCPRSFADGWENGTIRLKEVLQLVEEIKSIAQKYRYVDNPCQKIMIAIEEYEKE